MVVARGVRAAAVRSLARHRAHPNAVTVIGNLSQVGVLILAGFAILAIYTQGSFGLVLTSFGVVGLVLGLSVQDILRNFFSGLYILVERPFRIGDTIQVVPGVVDYTGVVAEISFRTTQLRTADGRELIVPNAVLMNSPVVNLTRFGNRSARLTVSVPAAQASSDIASKLREILAKGEGIARDPAPTVRLRGFGGGHASYEATVWGADRESAIGSAVAAIAASGAGWDVQPG